MNHFTLFFHRHQTLDATACICVDYYTTHITDERISYASTEPGILVEDTAEQCAATSGQASYEMITSVHRFCALM
jgi:hypothetical protein